MELEQKRIVYCRRQLAQTSACTETADCIVPDAFPDVGRVVYACGTAAIGDHAPQNGRLLISGTVQTVILYEPENGGGLRRLEVPLSFAHIEECAQLDSSSVCLVECRVSAVEASVVNSRKLSIAADLVLTAECYDKTACDYTENIADDHLELLSETCEAVLPDEAQLFSFSVLEDILVEETDGLSLLKQSCTLQITECRAMRDRIVVRGEAALRCLVMQLDGAVRTISKTTPFTQVFELTGAVEEDTPDAQLTVRSLECRIAADHSLSCTVNVDALVLLRRSHTLHCITDFYLPGVLLKTREDSASLYSNPEPQPFSAESVESIQTAAHISHVICADAVCCGVRAAEKGLQISASVQVLCLDDEQRLCSVQRVLPLTFTGIEAGTCLRPSLSVRAQTVGERGLTLTVTAEGECERETPLTLRHLCSVEQTARQADTGVTLLVRHIAEETRLWDIAKDCGSTRAAICAANDLPSDTAAVSDTMLLVPLRI